MFIHVYFGVVYGEDVVYPNNLTIKNIAYFAVAPTLCYQPSYPMTNKFRPAFFLKRLLELVIVCTMALGITEQYIRPTLYVCVCWDTKCLDDSTMCLGKIHWNPLLP